VLSFLAAPATTARAATDLGRYVFGSGGGSAFGSTSGVSGTFGQPLIGPASSPAPNSALVAGFWPGSIRTATSVGPNLPNPGVPVLHQNTPNPFNPATTISFSIPEAGPVWLDVYDLQGRHVVTLVEESLPAGRHELLFAPGNLASGIYFYRLRAEDYEKTRRMLLLK
jgi:hypothetical protein